MFFKKKEEKEGLPDLPMLPLEGFSSKKSTKLEVKGLDGTFGKFSSDKDEGTDASTELEDEVVIERHALPSFPDSPMGKSFSQSVIRDAVSDEDSQLPELPEIDGSLRVKEIEEKPVKIKSIDADELYRATQLVAAPRKVEEFRPIERNNDIFVKLDKFKSGRKSLGEVKERLNEIDFLLKRIRETKMREEQELVGWESELNFIKSKLKEVTENIFEKA